MKTLYYLTLRSSESVYGTYHIPELTKNTCAEKIAKIRMSEDETRTLIVVENHEGQLKQLSDHQIAILLGETMNFRIQVPTRPEYTAPIFRGTGNLTNALDYLAEFKEDVPNLADQVRIEYQLIQDWTPLND